MSARRLTEFQSELRQPEQHIDVLKATVRQPDKAEIQSLVKRFLFLTILYFFLFLYVNYIDNRFLGKETLNL